MAAILRVRDKEGQVREIPAFQGGVPFSRTVNGHPLSEDVTLSYRDVGAAPSGYGLGGTVGKICVDCNDAVQNGWYQLQGAACVNAPDKITSSGYGTMFVSVRKSTENESLVFQQVFFGGCSAQRWGNGVTKVFHEWEYVNPPMNVGVEYKTTERYKGKAVYKKLVDCGTLPNSGNQTVAHNISGGTIVGFEAFVTNTSGVVQSLPLVDTQGNPTAKVMVNQTGVTVYTFADVSTYTATCVLTYTKS